MRAARSTVIVGLLITTLGCQRVAAVGARPAALPVTCVAGSALDIAPASGRTALAGEDDDAGSAALHPCTGKTQEHVAATSALSALADRIRDLGDDARPAPVTEELEALLATPCFALTAGDPHDGLVFDSAISLKTWWDDGGESWVEHYLTLEAERTTVIAPSPRRTLTTASVPKHLLAPLLCPASDARSTSTTGCGHETTGWARRADRDLARRAAANHATNGSKSEDSCAKEALAAELVDRFSTYRDCLEEVTPRRDALPLGRFKAPVDGWFVVTGPRRRGCAEIRTYDLATGAAYMVSECTPQRGFRANPNPAPVLATVTGKLPLPMLREAAWMTLLAQVAETGTRTEAARFGVPAEIPITRPGPMGRGSTGGCGSSGPTRSWSWMREKSGVLVGQASGTLQSPSGCQDSADHAVELLDIAEDGLETGCAPAVAPKVSWSSPGAALRKGTTAPTFDAPETAAVRAELTRLAASRASACPKRP